MPEHKWDVGHRPGTQMRDGHAPTIDQVGPSHRKSELWPRNCNQIAGGKAGAAKTNLARRTLHQHPETRDWLR